ncbi:helix-turn-helix domain-containing protein [Anabaena subtropica]|uniref:Helix-turn-helix domain-containing protein n=1 Tax=Anabaena subtropica FACHB-260 TaxID=2692884 RepID=A0ABR8CT56_9NOST|nr:RodZ family helix-turn-helix domain-containing protein [Anabaena subtropica]MBD2346159.1 helix-turn-helix domain-containing protein [Anabaena subtropica FACHB-260]
MKWLKRKQDAQPQLSVEQQRAEKIAELGAQLWASRQERGLSLEEMVAMTKIPRRLLQAIEEGNLNDLPEPIYIQGLIRQFADAVGFNGAEFASNFPVASEQMKLQPVGEPKSIGLLRPIHLYLLYIFVIICSVSGLSQLLNNAELRANNNESTPVIGQGTVVNSQEKLIKTEPVSDDRASIGDHHSRDKSNQSVQIGVTLKASSWIRVVADGKTEFEGTLPEGTHRVWKAEEQLTVKTNNAGGVLMSVNQQAAKEMGQLGEEEEIKIAAAKPGL